MSDLITKEFGDVYPDRAFLTLEDVAQLLGCSRRVVYNWTRRKDPEARPPRIIVGKTIRFPKVAFIQWLLKEQGVH